MVRDGVQVAFQQEMAAVQQADLGAGRVGGEGQRAPGAEAGVVAAPEGQHRDTRA